MTPVRDRRSGHGRPRAGEPIHAGVGHPRGAGRLSSLIAAGVMVVASTTIAFAQQPGAGLVGTPVDVLAVRGEDGRRSTLPVAPAAMPAPHHWYVTAHRRA